MNTFRAFMALCWLTIATPAMYLYYKTLSPMLLTAINSPSPVPVAYLAGTTCLIGAFWFIGVDWAVHHLERELKAIPGL